MGCVERLTFGACSPTTTNVRSDLVPRFSCDGTQECASVTPPPGTTTTYILDKGPAPGIDCVACADATCGIPEAALPHSNCTCCITYWECPAPVAPTHPTECGTAPVYFGPGTSVTGGFPNGYLVASTDSTDTYRFINSGCVERLAFGNCSPTTEQVRSDLELRFNCDGTSQCGSLSPPPGTTTTYILDKGPAVGINCTECTNSACAVPEADLPLC